MIYEEITEDTLNEKLITYGNRKPYGQVVFVAGGAGSGKGFAIENFLDSSSFKIRDVDLLASLAFSLRSFFLGSLRSRSRCARTRTTSANRQTGRQTDRQTPN